MNVMFDLDGTLVHSLPGIEWSVNETLRAAGLTQVCPDLRQLIGPPVRDILAAVTGASDPAFLDRLECHFRLSYDAGGWCHTLCQPGVPDMLWRLLTDGVEMFVVTNKPSFATGRILESLKISRFFKEVACRDSRAPAFGCKAELLNDLLERRGLDRAESLMVGDTAEDYRAAEEAGVPCAIVAHGYGSEALPSGCIRISCWDELYPSLPGRRRLPLAPVLSEVTP